MKKQLAPRPAPLSELCDEELVALVQQKNDRQALTEMVERYTHWIWNYLGPRARRAGFQEKDLEDAVQDGLLFMLVRVIPRYHPTRPDGGPGSTFHTFFEHCLFNRFEDLCRGRRRAHRHLHLFADLGWGKGGNAPNGTLPCVAETADPAISAETHEQVDRLQAALERLPLDEYAMLAWVMDGISLPRIARSQGVSVATLHRVLRNVRARLRAEVDPSSN
jgi:RNA polymerase sigma factor (sigma-70 family)